MNPVPHSGPNVSPPLILAIQPDRRQASQLASIAKRISAELVLTESAARAVAVLGERLPDLILTPPLLSHKDEKAITERLHEFGDAGAHIQTLTVPIFETAEAPARKGGVLSSLRKSKRKVKAPSTETVASTADTFAEQVAIYLSCAVEARRASTPRKASRPEAPLAAELPQPAEAAWQTQADQPVLQPQESTSWEAPRQAPDTLPTIEELAARTPGVPEPDRSVETRIATIQTSALSVDVTPAPIATPADTPMVDALTTLVPVVSGAAQDRPLPVPVPARTLVAQLAMELRAAELAASSESTVRALPALPAASVETSVDVAAIVPLDTAASERAAVPLPDATPLAALRVDLPSIPVDEAASEHAAVPLPDATTLAALRVDLPATDLATEELAGIPALPGSVIDTSIDAVAAMAPLVHAADTSTLPAIASIPHVTQLPIELPSLIATDLRDAASLAFSPPIASVEMDIAAVVPMSAGEDTSMARVVPVPTVTPQVATLPMTLPPPDAAFERAAVPLVPDAATAMSMQAVAGIVPSVSAHAELGLPLPEVMPPADIAMQLSQTDIAASTHHSVLVAPALPAHPSENMTQTLAAIVPLASAAEHSVPVPMPTLVPYVAELPIELPSVTTSATGKGVLVVPAPPASVPRTSIDAVTAMMTAVLPSTVEPESSPSGLPTALPVRKKAKKQLSLKDRKAARKANRARTDRLDESSLFNPDECRFAALVAKLDEVAPGLDESRVSADVAGPPPARKQKRSPKRH